MEYGGNDYNIKSIDAPGSSANIKCEINLDFLKAGFHKAYDSGSLTLSALLQTFLPAGWTITGYAPGISRTINMENATDYDVMKQAIKTYAVAFQWHTLAKTVVVINPADKTPSGEYLTDELNLRSIAFKGESKDFITRLYPYGKDGLTIATANGGIEYVENHQYSDKIVCGSWSDDRYTVPDDLKADAVKKLAALSVPARSYDCDVIDLAKLDSKYSDFAFAMYKVVTLIDRKRKIRLDHQIMEYKEYPEQPEKNVLTLSSVIATVQDNVNQAQSTADAAQASADDAKKEVELANVTIGKLTVNIEATEKGLESKVSTSDLGTDIEQLPDSVVEAFNKKDGETQTIKFTGDGFDFSYNGTLLGHMGVAYDSELGGYEFCIQPVGGHSTYFADKDGYALMCMGAIKATSLAADGLISTNGYIQGIYKSHDGVVGKTGDITLMDSAGKPVHVEIKDGLWANDYY